MEEDKVSGLRCGCGCAGAGAVQGALRALQPERCSWGRVARMRGELQWSAPMCCAGRADKAVPLGGARKGVRHAQPAVYVGEQRLPVIVGL